MLPTPYIYIAMLPSTPLKVQPLVLSLEVWQPPRYQTITKWLSAEVILTQHDLQVT
jgi:hypothetical protein